MPAISAHPVVRTALRGLGRKPLIIPGLLNRINDFLGKYLTARRIQTIIFGALVRRALIAEKASPERTG